MIRRGRSGAAILAALGGAALTTLGACGSNDSNDSAPAVVAVGFTISSVGPGVARQPLDTVTVNAVTATGATVAEFNGDIQLSIGNNPGGATLLGASHRIASHGTATFDVGFDRAGSGYTLVVSADGLPPLTSAPIDVVTPAFEPVASGIAGGPVTSLAVSPPSSGGAPRVFVGAVGHVYRSDDRGFSWTPSGFNDDSQAVLLADPARPGVLYLNGSGGLKKTEDGGDSWFPIDPSSATRGSDYVNVLALSPSQPSVVYAFGEGLHRSDDGGQTWTDRGQPPMGCPTMAVDPSSSDIVYCFRLASGGTEKSIDGGESWTTVAGLPAGSEMVAVTPSALYAGSDEVLYRSTDGGASWSMIAIDGVGADLAYAPSRPDRVYLLRGNNIYVSNDGGASFVAPVLGRFLRVYSLTVDPTDPDVLYGGSNAGVYVSTDAGASWSLAADGMDGHFFNAVAVQPASPDTVLAVVEGNIRRTTDGGDTWTASSTGYGVWFDPAAANRAVACSSPTESFNSFSTSMDGGATFTGHGTSMTSCDRLLLTGDTLIASDETVISRSDDNGATWRKLDFASSNPIRGVAKDPTADTVVIATINQVFRWTDRDNAFQPVFTDQDTELTDLVEDPATGRLVLGTCSGIRLSTDGGASFGNVVDGTQAYCIQKMRSMGGALYAIVTEDSRKYPVLLTSTDHGDSWTRVDTSGVPRYGFIQAVTASGGGARIYLATAVGLFRTVR